MDVSGKRILVVGMGLSGRSAVDLLVGRGAVVSAYDQKKPEELDDELRNHLKEQHVSVFFGEEPTSLRGFDWIVVSPGVPTSTGIPARGICEGVPVIGEIEVAWLLKPVNYVAITGTNGKTTTTMLTGEIFKAAGWPTEVVGNVGVPVTQRVDAAQPDTWMITEVSSFQLETIREFHPVIAALLNVTPDHMDRHENIDNYRRTKARIFQNQVDGDYFIVNRDDAESWKVIADCKATVFPFSRRQELEFGCYVQDESIVIKDDKGYIHVLCQKDQLILPGNHNLENALAAAGIAFCAGISEKVIGRVLQEFQGVAHRLEYVGTRKGVFFRNDSKGTNVDASMKAIEAIDGPIILIAGGYDKGSTFESLVSSFGTKVRGLILMGDTAPRIHAAAQESGFRDIFIETSMEACVDRAIDLAQAGDTVLLSPACASWDMYQDYEQRGDHFKKCVEDRMLKMDGANGENGDSEEE